MHSTTNLSPTFGRTPGRTLGCILMASGMGVRFGSNKLLASFLGKPLIHQILSATDTDAFSKRVVVTRHPEIADLCRQKSIGVILHELPYRNDTVRLGLECFGEDLPDGCMFCPCDQPLLSRETLEKMTHAFLNDRNIYINYPIRGIHQAL